MQRRVQCHDTVEAVVGNGRPPAAGHVRVDEPDPHLRGGGGDGGEIRCGPDGAQAIRVRRRQVQERDVDAAPCEPPGNRTVWNRVIGKAPGREACSVFRRDKESARAGRGMNIPVVDPVHARQPDAGKADLGAGRGLGFQRRHQGGAFAAAAGHVNRGPRLQAADGVSEGERDRHEVWCTGEAPGNASDSSGATDRVRSIALPAPACSKPPHRISRDEFP